jgi:hypothetical protein
MSKKKFIFLFSIFLIIIGITSTTLNAKATNPEHLDLLYDEETGYLSIYVVHGVTHEDEHYVDSLLITVNGTTAVDWTFTSQETYNILHFDHTFADPIPATHDIIFVQVTCNFGGEFHEELILGYRRPGHEEAFSSVIPPVVVSTILVIIILLLPKILIKDKEILVHQ